MIDSLISDDRTSWPPIAEAVIATSAASMDDPVYVTIPSFDPHQRYGPCRWMSNAGAMPQRGDIAIVAFTSDEHTPTVIFWWRPGIVP